MILSALNEYYNRLASRGGGVVPIPGYSSEKISYAIVLAPDGTAVDVEDVRDVSGKKPLPTLRAVPAAFKRSGTAPRPFFLWDKTDYALGLARSASGTVETTPAQHAAFVEMHRHWLNGESDAGLRSLLAFLDRWKIDDFHPPPFREEMLGSNIIFRLDGVRGYVHESEAARAIQARRLKASAGRSGVCLVSGQEEPLARLHPAIKGVRDAQSAGASIVSFNDDAYLSYKGVLTNLQGEQSGNDSGATAPVGERAVFGYTTALNYLLRREQQRIHIGDTTVVFWALAATPEQADEAEALFEHLLQPPADDGLETAKLRSVLECAAKGRALREIDPRLDADSRLFVLGLAPNAARLSIRYWFTGSLDEFVSRLATHYADLAIDPLPWKIGPAVWRLVLATAIERAGKADADDVPPQLAGDVLRAVLTGARYPRTLLSRVIGRMRADHDVSGIRVAVCKAVLTRDIRHRVNRTGEEVPVSIDRASTNAGYRMGRLFAVLENIQRAALGSQVNATIRDKYYGAASATPAAVFPLLLRTAQHHLGRLRKDKPGLAIVLNREIQDIVSGLDTSFPRSLRVEDQGRFAIGYYHQSKERGASPGGPRDIEESASGDME